MGNITRICAPIQTSSNIEQQQRTFYIIRVYMCISSFTHIALHSIWPHGKQRIFFHTTEIWHLFSNNTVWLLVDHIPIKYLRFFLHLGSTPFFKLIAIFVILIYCSQVHLISHHSKDAKLNKNIYHIYIFPWSMKAYIKSVEMFNDTTCSRVYRLHVTFWM